MPSLLSRNTFLVIAVKNYAKADTKVFCFCPIFLEFFTLLHVFCQSLQSFMSNSLGVESLSMGKHFRKRKERDYLERYIFVMLNI